MRRSFLAVSVLALALTAPLLSMPGGGPGPGFGDLVDPRALAHYLELTEEQIESSRELKAAAREASEPIRVENQELEVQLRELLEAGNASPSEVGDIVIAIHGNRGELRAIQEQFEADFVHLLTPEQQDRYANLKEVVQVVRWSLSHDPPPQPPPGNGGGPGQP